MCAPAAPEAPDPQDLANAQTGTNVATTAANTGAGFVGLDNPFGTIEYDQTGTYSYTDPNSGTTYELPKYTAKTTLSPEQQVIFDSTTSAKGNLAETADQQSAFLRDYLKNTESVTDSIDSKLHDLGRQRIDPRFAAEEDALRTRLSAQGIVPGSEAYNREIELMNQGKNDAYNQLLLSGRSQAVNETNMPINRIAALLSGAQIQSPGQPQTSTAQMPTVDIAGLRTNQYQQQLQQWQQQQQQRQSILGGLFDLGAAGITGGLFQ